MGQTIEYIKAVRQLKHMVKHMKKNKELKKEFDLWLDKRYKGKTEKEVNKIMQSDISHIYAMIEHYEEIKDKYQ